MATEPIYEGLAPTGRIVSDQVAVPRRPEDLTNKTIAFVWDYLFKGPIIFDAVQELIESRFTGVKFIGYENFPDIHGLHGVEVDQVLRELPEQLHHLKADAAVVAVGA